MTLEAGRAEIFGTAALLPLIDHEGLCGILQLGEGLPAEGSDEVWDLCRNFLCLRLRTAMGKREEEALPGPAAFGDAFERGLAVTCGDLGLKPVFQALERGGHVPVPELIRSLVLETLRELGGPRDSCGLSPDGRLWLVVVTATPPDTDLLSFTICDALAEKIPLSAGELQKFLRLKPADDAADAQAFLTE